MKFIGTLLIIWLVITTIIGLIILIAAGLWLLTLPYMILKALLVKLVHVIC